LLLTVGRIGRAHGVRGEVTVEVRTDDPSARFVPGALLQTDPSERGPLRIESLRWHNARLLITFAGRTDRDAAEALRNTWLLADVDVTAARDQDEFHIAQIVGCVASDESGNVIGEVIDVLALPGGDTLVIERAGSELLVPFVRRHVPKLDVHNKSLTVVDWEELV